MLFWPGTKYITNLLSIGRGVLIDYAGWAEKKGIEYSTFSTHQVRLSDIQEIATECGITFQKGDILFVRVGVTKEWDTVMTDAQKQEYSDNSSPSHAGVEATPDVLRWLWDTGFCAIASDAISWEVRHPLMFSGKAQLTIGRFIHLSRRCFCMNMSWPDGGCR